MLTASSGNARETMENRPSPRACGTNWTERYAERMTKRAVILEHAWILIDFDPRHCKGTCSTDAEHRAALEWTRQCRDFLREQGWPEPMIADSGNSAHLLYRIDRSSDPARTELLGRCLAGGSCWEADRAKPSIRQSP